MTSSYRTHGRNPLMEGSPKSKVQSPKSAETPSTVYRLPSTLFLLSAWLYLLTVIAAWAAMRWGADRWWWATVVAYLPCWMWAAPLGVFLPAMLFRPRRLWLVTTLMAVWIGWPLMGFCFSSVVRSPWSVVDSGQPTTDNGQRTTVRVLTCNVGLGYYDPVELASLIAESEPDLVALQESITAEELSAAVGPGWHVVAIRGMAVASRWPIVGSDMLTWPGKYGPRPVALRVRVRVPAGDRAEGEGGTQQRAADGTAERACYDTEADGATGGTPQRAADGTAERACYDTEADGATGGTHQRAADSTAERGGGETGADGTAERACYDTRTVAEAEGEEFDFVSLHLYTPRKGLEAVKEHQQSATERMRANTEVRDAESAKVRRWVEAFAGPVIVAGDMNMPPESALFKRDWASFADAFTAAGVGYGYTYGYTTSGWLYGIRIDHILADSDWRVERCSVGRHIGSDHRPVVAELVRHSNVKN